MDNKQAKVILQAYRPGGADAVDPFFAAALEQARLDPGLREWFAGQCAFDENISRAVHTEQPPTGLRDDILMICRVDGYSRSRPFWKHHQWLALAAAVVILLGVSALFIKFRAEGPMHMATLTGEIGHIQQTMPSLGAMSSNLAELRNWLGQRGAPHDFSIPAGLDSTMGLGCQIYSIHGNKVSLVCFQLKNKEIVHYFVVDRDRLVDPPNIGKTVYMERNGVSFAVWSDERRTYVLAGAIPTDRIKSLF